ncbi:MAG TPA: hypothetical protein VD906_07310, partial [Caulobacteraceae bacterium]|nr:hypothetical protein [Caulobacteraceae bacterium]
MGTLKNSKAAVQARGEVMSNSVVTRTRKRLSLFVGSSLAVASVMSIAGAVALAPSAAMAYDECTPTNPPTTQSDGAGGVQDVTLNGAANDSFTCTGTHASIRYPSTSGNLTLTLANGPIVTTGGIAVTATGANTVTLNRNDGTAGAGDPSISSTNGAGIQVTTGTGLIALALTDGDPAGGDAPLAITGTTRGVQLQSGATAGQAINLTFTSGSITATATDGIGVEATTTSVAGGNMVLSLGGGVSGATGVRATMNGTGVLQVQVPGITSTVLGGEVVGTNGAAIRLTPSSSGTLANAATVLVGAGRTVRANNPGGAVIEFTTSAPSRVVSVNNTGIIRSNDTTSAGYDDLIISVAGGGGNSAINNNRSSLFDHGLYGRVSLLNTGTATAANGMGEWHTAGVNTIGGAGSTGTLSTDTSGNARGTIYTNVDGAPTSFVFGDATDTFDNAGRLAVGEGAEAAATLTFSGLETWTNRGHVLFGTNSELVSQFGELVESDEVANDRVAAQGAAFNGTTESSSSGLLLSSSYLVMDVDFSANQMDCTAAVTADCLDLRGGSAVGSTAIRINNAGAGSAERLVLVDVTGAGAATSSATAFTLDPESDGYRTLNGGAALEGGLFLYTLDFDDGQYALTATEFGGRALEVARFGRAAT